MSSTSAASSPYLLYLVRHAKSAWDDRSLDDFERPLNARGRRDAERMGAHFAAMNQTLGMQPLLLSSPAVRAMTTARSFAAAQGSDPRLIRIHGHIYEATAGDWVEVLRTQDASQHCIAAFGHNPGISDFARWLCEDLSQQDFSTATVAALTLQCSWDEITPGCATLRELTRPRDLGAPA